MNKNRSYATYGTHRTYYRERTQFMNSPDRKSYMAPLIQVMQTHWPENRAVNIACHGHSVPAGYFATPMVDSLNAYPHLLYAGMKHRFPFAVINVIVTAIGGENSESGSQRFGDEVLCHRPDVVTIDYGLNDRGIGLARARECWVSMIEAALAAGSRLILLTPTPDITQAPDYDGDDADLLPQHAQQIRDLAAEYNVALVDSFTVCLDYAREHVLSDILSWGNHPNRAGHELVTRELLRWFPAG